MTSTVLPQIAYLTNVVDAGADGTNCPHCGAKGRYVYHFHTTDGQELAAMRGCLGRFPQSLLVSKHARLLDKQAEYQAKGWTLPEWDTAVMTAIEKCGYGEITYKDASKLVAAAEKRRNAHLTKKFGWR